MKLDQLRSFVSVATHLNLRLAATELGLTQPAVSKQLAALQRELGVSFYKRHAKGIELTQAGRSLFTKLAPLVRDVETLPLFFQKKAQAEQKRPLLTVAATYSFARRIVPSLLARFEAQNPNLEIRWDSGSSRQVQQMVRDRQVEIALSGYRPLFDDLVSEPFQIQQLVFFVNRRHPLAHRRRVTLREVLAHPLVIRNVDSEPTLTHDILEELRLKGYKYKVALWCGAPLLVREAVAKNIGVGISYLENLRVDLRRGRFVVLKGSDFHFTALSHVIYSDQRELSPIAQNFLDLLRLSQKVQSGKNLKELGVLLNHRSLNLATKPR